jgi:probable rRNA maturation factor
MQVGGQLRPSRFAFATMVIFQKTADSADHTELTRFARRARKLAGIRGEVAILVTDNRQLRDLNRRFRRKNKATDVLSFPHADGAGGDIAVSADMARKNAARYGHETLEELKILVLHGMLHLAGYDHETDNGKMAAHELVLRARLKLPASLIDRNLATNRTLISAAKRRAHRGKA